MPEQDTRPPHAYVPPGPAETQPFEGGYQPAEVRREALAAVLDGIPLGAYDKRITEWLVQLDDTTCRTFASIMWRCRVAGLPGNGPVPGTATQWGVSFSNPGQIPQGPVQRYRDEGDARQAKREVEALDPSHRGTVVSRQAWTGPWTPVPDEEDGDA